MSFVPEFKLDDAFEVIEKNLTPERKQDFIDSFQFLKSKEMLDPVDTEHSGND